MKKLLLISLALLLSASAIAAPPHNEWYFSAGLHGNYQGNYLSKDFSETHVGQWQAGIGVGVHRMLGKKFSVGLNLTFASEGAIRDANTLFSSKATDHLEYIGLHLAVAHFKKVREWLYYVPEFSIGMSHILNKEFLPDEMMGRNTLMIGLSLVGLEFRPNPNLGLRINTVNLQYDHNKKTNGIALSFMPTLSANILF